MRRARSAEIRRERRGGLLRFEIRRRRRHEGLGLRLGEEGVRRKEESRSVAAISRRIPPSPRAFRLGERACRDSGEQPLRPDGRGGGQRARSAGRYGLRGGAAGGVSAAAAVNRRPTISRRATVFLSKTFGVAGKSLI